jgi:type VI protein secretion system component Hcp
MGLDRLKIPAVGPPWALLCRREAINSISILPNVKGGNTMKTSQLAALRPRLQFLVFICVIITPIALTVGGLPVAIHAQDQLPERPGIEIYVQFPGIPGSSITAGYVGWSDALGVGFDLAATLSDNPRSSGISSLEGINILKMISIDSPILALACAKGTPLGAVTIDFVAFGSPLVVYKIILHGTRVRSVSSTSLSLEDFFTEKIKLQGDRIEWIANNFSPDGTLIGTIRTCWDFAMRRDCGD